MPGVRNVDVNLVKNFNFTEATKLQFRCEVFNLFNHPQVWGINTGFSGDNPGSAISDQRQEFRAGEFLSRRPNSCSWLSDSASSANVSLLSRRPRYRRMAGPSCVRGYNCTPALEDDARLPDSMLLNARQLHSGYLPRTRYRVTGPAG